MKQELVALVLAGGAGSRFWPLTTNKVVFPFLGKPLSDFSVRDVLPSGVSRVVMVTSRDNQSNLQRLRFPVPAVTVVQQKPLGMADAILSADSEIAGAELLVLIADDLMDRTLVDRVVERARSSGVFGVVPGWKTDRYFSGGYLKLKGDRIMGLIEKPGEGKTPSPYVAISGQYIRSSTELLNEIKRTRVTGDDIYERSLSNLMQHEEFVVEPYEGAFVSLKYSWHVLDAMDLLLANRIKSHKGKGVEIRDHVTIEGNVFLDDGVKIYENTKIVGPCYIGKNTIVGNNNIIRASHVGANCVTGFSTDITRSYVGDDCWFHANYIGDSVVEAGVSMGSGAVLANLRLDDGEIASGMANTRIPTGRRKLGAILAKGVRIGVNASIMPGIKVGTGSFIGSGVVLTKDLPEATFCQQKKEFVLEKNTKISGLPSREEFKKSFV